MNKAQQNLIKVGEVKAKLQMGVITYDEAKELLKPVINDMNKTAAKIAKKYGKKAVLFSHVGLLR